MSCHRGEGHEPCFHIASDAEQLFDVAWRSGAAGVRRGGGNAGLAWAGEVFRASVSLAGGWSFRQRCTGIGDIALAGSSGRSGLERPGLASSTTRCRPGPCERRKPGRLFGPWPLAAAAFHAPPCGGPALAALASGAKKRRRPALARPALRAVFPADDGQAWQRRRRLARCS